MGFTVKAFEGDYAKKANVAFGVETAFLEFNPGKCLMPPFYVEMAQRIVDAPIRSDDVWLLSFPRTGSTWCQEMIWLISNNLDFETARNTIQQKRAPLIELTTVVFEYADKLEKVFQDSIQFVENLPSPRFIKSHLPISLLPSQLDKVKPKIIYTLRHPKDLCVSYFHHCQMFHNLSITFEEFCDLFLNDATPIGSLWQHYITFWNKRHETNILILRYEDMKNNLRGTLKQIAEFLEKPLEDDDLEDLCEFLSFQKMRNNRGCNLEDLVNLKMGQDYYKHSDKHFIRKGIVGDWKNFMSDEMSGKFDRWIEENTKNTGLTF